MRVKYFPNQPHCFEFGGFELQMLNALAAVRNVGVDATTFDIWDRSLDFEMLHIWGIGPHNSRVIKYAKQYGIKVIASVLVPYYDTTRLRLSYLRNRYSVWFRDLINLYSLVDRFTVVNDMQKEVLVRYYLVEDSRIHVVPNIISKKYIDSKEGPGRDVQLDGDFVLCTGNVSKRKNQCNLIEACTQLKMNVLIVGNVSSGDLAYREKFLSLAQQENVKWISGVDKDSDTLLEAYLNCSVFALPSIDETQPISALEAAAVNAKCILMDRAYAMDKHYVGAFLCKSGSVEDIRNSIKLAIGANVTESNHSILMDCTEENVGASYFGVYRELCG